MTTKTSYPNALDTESTLKSVNNITQTLSSWLIKNGIGYSDFINSQKAVFYNAAILELERLNRKKTDSSISLLSGLNRRDVVQFRLEQDNQHKYIESPEINPLASVPARVIALWIDKDIGMTIPYSDTENSFESLVSEISTEKHPKSILLELNRLGLVYFDKNFVYLLTNSFTPSKAPQVNQDILSNNITQHLSAGLHNLMHEDNQYLEQAISVDKITAESVATLNKLTLALWSEFSKKLLSEATKCSKNDQSNIDATQSFILGIYQNY
jgi:hypothetical protein